MTDSCIAQFVCAICKCQYWGTLGRTICQMCEENHPEMATKEIPVNIAEPNPINNIFQHTVLGADARGDLKPVALSERGAILHEHRTAPPSFVTFDVNPDTDEFKRTKAALNVDAIVEFAELHEADGSSYVAVLYRSVVAEISGSQLKTPPTMRALRAKGTFDEVLARINAAAGG